MRTSSTASRRLLAPPLLALLFAVAAAAPAQAAEPVALTHVHGLSYSADGARLMIPNHHGLAIYENGRWSKGAGPAHDYMGFAATRDALYSSGHPEPGADLPNPFGLIRSSDSGKTWRKLGLEGQADFHMLAASYGTNAVYVLSHEPNARMKQAGIYQPPHDGMKWTHGAAAGLEGEVKTLAVHPIDPKIVAAGTAGGLYLSRDSAERFERLVGGRQVLAATFDLDGRHPWFSVYADRPALLRVALDAGAQPATLPLPSLTEDAVAYIAQNPVRHDEIAIATFKRSVYVSQDQGQHWKQIAQNGAVQP